MKLLIVFALIMAIFLESSTFQAIMLLFIVIGLYSIRKKITCTQCAHLSSTEDSINENTKDILHELKKTRNDLSVHATMVKKNLNNLQDLIEEALDSMRKNDIQH